MNETKCAVAPVQQLRDIACDMVSMIEKANEIAETINDKLFGENVCETSEKACQPYNVLCAVDRSIAQIHKLLNKLDSVNSRL
jgi:hypothetical protein